VASLEPRIAGEQSILSGVPPKVLLCRFNGLENMIGINLNGKEVPTTT